VRTHVLDAIERIVNAEAQASAAPRAPEITTTEHYAPTVNDPARTERVAGALRARFGADRVRQLGAPFSAGEDFGSFGTEWGVPSVFWYVGGTDPDAWRAADGRLVRFGSHGGRPDPPRPRGAVSRAGSQGTRRIGRMTGVVARRAGRPRAPSA
jgi:metal-dependent amidase/aminoacylase/carboxypeptidase family protein